MTVLHQATTAATLRKPGALPIKSAAMKRELRRRDEQAVEELLALSLD